MPTVLLLCGVAACVLAAFNLRRSRALARLLCPGAPHPGAAVHDLPSVSVLAPCCGIDRHFERYVRALLSQDYPRYAVLFVVESAVDPAWGELKRILADTPEVHASLIIAGTAQECSQKIHNLLVGIAHVVPETSVLAFVDSDVQVHPHWLRALVMPLDDAAVGATSGYRWYVPSSGSVAESLRSAWNAATLGLMTHPCYGFAWGGSSAIRREVFEKLEIPEAWARGLSDDLLLTQAVRAAGLRIAFVADDLVPTLEPCTWRQLIEWTNRQVTIGRIYVPHSWSASLLVHLTSLTLGALGLTAVVSDEWFASVLLLSYWLINGIGSLAVCRAALRRLSAHGFAISQGAWPQALWGPAVTVLALVNIVASLMTQTITWRGISYTMQSPQHVVVHRDALAPVSSSRTS
jgi:cellulose synthase/poly-beta-1,6-N-acetylglucosamine synthase-like glycosyltransferase